MALPATTHPEKVVGYWICIADHSDPIDGSRRSPPRKKGLIRYLQRRWSHVKAESSVVLDREALRLGSELTLLKQNPGITRRSRHSSGKYGRDGEFFCSCCSVCL